MIWRTCGSLSDSSARSAYSTRAVGFVAPAETRPRYCGVSASSRSSRRPRASFVAVPREGIRSPRMRREIVEWSTPDCWASCRWDIFLALSWARSHSLNARPFCVVIVPMGAPWTRSRSVPLCKHYPVRGRGPVSPVGTGPPRHSEPRSERCGAEDGRAVRSIEWAVRAGCTGPGHPLPTRPAQMDTTGTRDRMPRPSGRRRREGLQVPCAVQPGTAAQRREHVRDAAEHDDRQDADRPVDERDRRRHLDRQPVRGGHDAADAELDDAESGRAERHRGEERADEGDEERPADPEVDARDAKGLDDEEQAQRLGGPDEAGD